jgi:hypothetical protein
MIKQSGGIMKSAGTAITIFILILATNLFGKSPELKKFESDYENLNIDLLNQSCEVFEVKNFVYKKDLAKFTFDSGTFYFLRYLSGRPNTAIFVGQGRANIKIPSHAERNSLYCISKDSSVNEPFETCFIRFGDNFDNSVRSEFAGTESSLHWKIYNIAKQTQGEVFFKPVIQHTYDNYFQLLRSVYERADDGFFWIDFNRYVYKFDPNQPEEFRLAYEFEGGDFNITEAAILQRQERNKYDDMELTDIDYPTTILNRHAKLTMGGQDGLQIDAGETAVKLVINTDSLKYLSLFLDYHLDEDSIYLFDNPVDYKRRNTFDFIGIIMPKYYYKGDTLEFKLWFKGKDFRQALPYVENPEASTVSFEFKVRSGSNYYMPGITDTKKVKGGELIESYPDRPYNTFYYQGYVAGTDTNVITSNSGIPLNFLHLEHINKHNFSCYLPENIQEVSALAAFNFMSERLGAPSGAFEIFICPEERPGMPGLAYVPQVACVSDWEAFGGIDLLAGNGMANQWFGGAMRPGSYREAWAMLALSRYLSLLYLENERDSRTYYSNMFNRADTLSKSFSRGWDLPLVSGTRMYNSLLANKGIWLMHMLRFMMFDPEKRTAPNFYKFLQELSITCNSRTFTNADFIQLAEKYYGGSLKDFFAQWLYGYGVPEFNVDYSISQRDGSYFIDADVRTKKVDMDFVMPVIMRVELKGGSAEESIYASQVVSAPQSSFTLGPFEMEPKKFVFNEFFSVLSNDHVNKK